MPSLGADMDAGRVSKWLVKPGDAVRRGDIVAVVETEKSTIEVEIFDTGVIEALLVPEGDEVPVGTVLARVASTQASTLPGAATTAPAPQPAVAPGEQRAPARRQAPPARPVRVAGRPTRERRAASAAVTSPVVRHLAETLGVDISTVVGTGRGGAVTRADVERAASRTGKRTRPRSSPLARRLAVEFGLDLASLTGSGPLGAVVEDDVRRAAAAPSTPASQAEAPPSTATGPLAPSATGTTSGPTTTDDTTATEVAAADRSASLRRAIGNLMARSKKEIPHYYLSTTIDMSKATAWLEEANLERPMAERLLMAALLLKATARAVAAVPEMNGFMIDDRFEPSEAVHLGVAISMRSGGVMAPAIHDANRLSPHELMAKLRDLVTRARSGVLRSSEMSDPTMTVTNLGDLGVEAVFGVIYPPQVALVGFGRVGERPWASEGMLGVRPCVTATLSADHRVSDGHRGGIFLATIDRLLQEPEGL